MSSSPTRATSAPSLVPAIANFPDAIRGSSGLTTKSMSSSFNGGFTLSQLQKARKQSEEDAQVLANRVAYLLSQHDKVSQRIESTKLQALEIEQRPIKSNLQEAIVRDRCEEILSKQRKNACAREQRQLARKTVQAALLQGRRRKAQEVRETSRQMLELKSVAEGSLFRSVSQRSHELKERMVGEEKDRLAEEVRLQKAQKAQQDRENKSKFEVQLRGKISKRIAQMEVQKQDAMQILEAKRLEQQLADEQLAAVVECRRMTMSQHTKSSSLSTL